MITRTFATEYLTAAGILMVLGDDYVILVRVRDGLCRRFSYRELGFASEVFKRVESPNV